MQWKKRFQKDTNLVSKKTIPLLTQFFLFPWDIVHQEMAIPDF
jgi:hypothetical protein